MMRILDLFCGAGGAAEGYAYAGFEVTGIDIKKQNRYPYKFIQMDVMRLRPEHIVEHFDAIHASPPCQLYSSLGQLHQGTDYHERHPDLVEPTRRLLEKTGLPYVIENVPGAPLLDPIVLCGSSFGLRVRRHRLFECNFPIVAPPCDHGWQQARPLYNKSQYKGGKRKVLSGTVNVYGQGCGLGPGEIEVWRDVMEMPGHTLRGMSQAIPPAFTEYIGNRLRRHIIDLGRDVVNGT